MATAQLGIEIGQTWVASTWQGPGDPHRKGGSLLRNHADGIASIDLFVVPTLSFRLLTAFSFSLTVRRQILSLGMTARPTAEWMRPATHRGLRLGMEAGLHRPRSQLCLWRSFHRRLRAMGIRGPADLAAVAMAERTCRTADWLDRREFLDMSSSWRAAYASPPHFLLWPIQRRDTPSLNKDRQSHRLFRPYGTSSTPVSGAYAINISGFNFRHRQGCRGGQSVFPAGVQEPGPAAARHHA